MNILYYLDNFPKISETFILNEISQLEKEGHKVTIVALNNPENNLAHDELKELEADVFYLEFPDYSDFGQLLKKELFTKRYLDTIELRNGLKVNLVQAFRTRKLLELIQKKDLKPDIIHTHFSTHSKLPVYSISEIRDIPWTIEVHAYDIFQEDRKDFSKRFLDKPDGIITVSEYNKRYLEQELEIDNVIDSVPVSVRSEKFKPQDTEEKNRLVSVGRLVEKKGLSYGLRAFSKLKEEYNNLEYHIIGEGKLKNSLKQQARELGVEEDVKFLGYISDERLTKEIERAKVFLLPCVRAENGDMDAMPMVLKEAMAMKTPCVSTKISGIPELIEHGEDGCLVDPEDSQKLKEAVSYLLDSKRKREVLGEKARNKVKRDYEISKNIKLIERSLEKAVN